MKPITINVVVISAKGLKSNTGKHRFCVQVKVGRSKQKTSVVEDLFGNPSFNKEFIFSSDNLKNELKLKVTEKNDKDVLGQVVVQLSDLCHERSLNPDRVPLRTHKKCPLPCGELLFDAWISGITSSNLNLAKNSTSNESLRSMGGLKKLKEKLHASALKLNPSKGEKSEMKKSHLSIFTGKSKGIFSSKNKTSVSCQDLSGGSFQPFKGGGTPFGSYKSSNEDLSYAGSGTSSRKSSNNSPPGFALQPEITGISPSSGDCRGGTVLTIRGSYLGKNAKDVLHVYVCGHDMVDQVRFLSSQKLILTTLPCNPSKGNIAVVTQSGGLGTSSVEFAFIGSVDARSSSDSPVSVNGEKVLSNDSTFFTNGRYSDASKSPSPPPRFNKRTKELSIIRESPQDESQEVSKSYHKKTSSLSRSGIFLSINQSPPHTSKKLSLFDSVDGDNAPGSTTNNMKSVADDDFNDDSKKSSLNDHDFSTPEGIQMFYNHSDTGLAERLSEYYQRPVELPTKQPEREVRKISMEEEDLKPYINRHLSNVCFSIGDDLSSDDESAKKVKVVPRNHFKSPSSSKNSSDTNISDNLGLPQVETQMLTTEIIDGMQRHVPARDTVESLSNHILGEQVIEIQSISRKTSSNDACEPSKEDTKSLYKDLTESINDKADGVSRRDFEKKSQNSPPSSTSSTKSGSPSFNAPTKPPRVKEFAELKDQFASSRRVRDNNINDVITPGTGKDVDDDDDHDDHVCGQDNERVKRLEEEIYAKEISLHELRDQNKVLIEERNLLRRYIEALISRALSTCPEILCTDGGRSISLN